MAPRVSFVVPCYRLAHLLRECVDSILAQTFTDLEVLIMDDCSPDDTPAVAASFRDPRVRYLRNEPNLGHLRNYNKGIALAKGEFVWLISADDRLRVPYVVERFVRALDAHPSAGYVFCPAIKFTTEGETVSYGDQGGGDRLIRGHAFLRTLAGGNPVPAPAGMVRRTCYQRITDFPLDLPFAGDWYLWSMFALWHDVMYLTEPMVSYRVHTMNMTLDFKSRVDALVADDLTVSWRMKEQAEAAGMAAVVRLYRRGLAWNYAIRVSRKIADNWRCGLSLDAFEQSLAAHHSNAAERSLARAVTYALVGDAYYDAGDLTQARAFYRAALKQRPTDLRTGLKCLLAYGGAAGRRLRVAAS